LKKHSKGRFKVGQLEYAGLITRWIRLCLGLCLGLAILAGACTPLIWAIGRAFADVMAVLPDVIYALRG